MLRDKFHFRDNLDHYPVDAISLIDDVFSFQYDGYQEFLYGKSKKSLYAIVASSFPISDLFESFKIEFLSLEVKKPIMKPEDCFKVDSSYVSEVSVRLRMKFFSEDKDTSKKTLINVTDQDIILFEIPVMTNDGKFIMNGVERIVVSQIHRSPGVIFNNDKNGLHSKYTASIIPYSGTWIDFELNESGLINVYIDKRRRLDLTMFLIAIGLKKSDIVHRFYKPIDVSLVNKDLMLCKIETNLDSLKFSRFAYTLYDASGNVILQAGAVLTQKKISEIEKDGFICNLNEISQFLSSYDDVDSEDIFAGDLVPVENFIALVSKKKSFSLLDFTAKEYTDTILKNIQNFTTIDSEDAASTALKMIKRSDISSNATSSVETFRSYIFNENRLNMSPVGRYKINISTKSQNNSNALNEDDLFCVIDELLEVKKNPSAIEDVDSLKNRRIKNCSELIGNIISMSMKSLEKIAVDRLSNLASEVLVSPMAIFSPNQISKSVKDFMLTSQLSQLLEQTNPLSELSHKRRISALGPGGVERDRVGIEVRDVHQTHYGRICIVETPDSQNIGLISNFACFGRVNEYGFIETPYRVVKDRKIQEEIVYLDSIQEQKHVIVGYSTDYYNSKEITSDVVNIRYKGEFMTITSDKVEYIDVSPNQPLSQTASLIPFCEANDSYRVLMSASMHRQAVPVINPEAPIIGTGFERFVGTKSPSVIKSSTDGIVTYVDSEKIYISENKTNKLFSFFLKKFKRTNNSTCTSFSPCVTIGQNVKKDEVIADGLASEGSEIALGKNLNVAFMSWNGYGFEDSVIISEKVVAQDKMTSIHIEEFEVVVMDTRLGSEQVTASIPGTNPKYLMNLDESGVVRIGTFVRPGDILVGKITPKAEVPMTPEEKLLRSIFGEGRTDVRNTSLTLPPGYSGTVTDISIISRRGVNKLGTQVELEAKEIRKIELDLGCKLEILMKHCSSEIIETIPGAKISKECKLKTVPISRNMEREFLNNLTLKEVMSLKLESEKDSKTLTEIVNKYATIKKEFEEVAKNSINEVREEKYLQNAILYKIKVCVATKSPIQPGDKVAGRHGNKGIISKIVPVADMPFMKDGTPIDVIVNPLGIVARMNLGQVLELSLGLSSMTIGKEIDKMVSEQRSTSEIKSALDKYIQDKGLKKRIKAMNDEEIKKISRLYSKGVPYCVPVFSGIDYKNVQNVLKNVCGDSSGQVDLYDGKTGEKFERKISVGIMYLLKLHHMVDKKVHARSVGPYSLITQQPLGGKTNFGGQRLGEMECWAIEAYGAANILSEMLTLKSDDVYGRKSMYNAIISGSNDFKRGIPESFNVLLKELMALGLNVTLKNDNI